MAVYFAAVSPWIAAGGQPAQDRLAASASSVRGYRL